MKVPAVALQLLFAMLCGALCQAEPQSGATAPGRDATSPITVGKNVQVSLANRDRAHWEVRISSDPTDPSRLLACSMIHSAQQNSVHTVVYVSSDGGNSWKPTLEPENLLQEGDPDCILGAGGTAIFTTLMQNWQGASRPLHEMAVYHSSNGGMTWEQPVFQPFIDREYLTMDNSNGKNRGLLYINGDAVEKTEDGANRLAFTLFRSKDLGKTFLPPVQLQPDASNRANGNGEVLSNGHYVALFVTSDHDHPVDGKSDGKVKVLRSEDGGETFLKANVAASWTSCKSPTGLPELAVDKSDGPFKNRLYAVWTDSRSGHCDILFAYSKDEGKTWSPVKTVNDDPERDSTARIVDHEMAMVAVNNKGVIGFAWYDRRDEPANRGWQTRFTASLDGGETLLPSVRISEGAEKPTSGQPLPVWLFTRGGGTYYASLRSDTLHTEVTLPQWGSGDVYGGDTAGMAADAKGVFHPLWVDNRTGLLQLWTAQVMVSGEAVPNGSRLLTDLQDVTQNIALDYSKVTYDAATGRIAFDVALANTSNVAISTPVRVRVLRLNVGSGSARVVNADNDETGTGAIWDFSSNIMGKLLSPGMKSEPKRLELGLSGIHPFENTRNFPINLVTIDSRVFANVPNSRTAPDSKK